MARQRMSALGLSRLTQLNRMTVLRRLRAEQPFTVPEILAIAHALNVRVETLLADDPAEGAA